VFDGGINIHNRFKLMFPGSKWVPKSKSPSRTWILDGQDFPTLGVKLANKTLALIGSWFLETALILLDSPLGTNS